jgi:hypothetical protein
MSVIEFMTLLGFSKTHHALQSSSSEKQSGIGTEEIEKVQRALARGAKTFLHGNTDFWKEGTFIRCLNKIKHGLLVMRGTETSNGHEFLLIFADGNQTDVALPSVTSEETSSRMILSQVANFTVVLVSMLTILFQTRFGCFPEGEPPEELVRAFNDGCGLDAESGN